jgi:hypothetical protein
VWKNSFNSKVIFVNKGKKNKHSLQILAALALNGPSTTREIAKFVIKQSNDYPYWNPRNQHSRVLEQMFLRLIEGRQRKTTGKKKSLEMYPSLESNHYVRKVRKEKKSDSNQYMLTLKGFLFALGFNFEGKDMEDFLHNARRNHLFFAYIENIAKESSYNFAKKIFLDSLYEIIKNEIVSIDKDISFYFSIFAEGIGQQLNKQVEEMLKSIGKDRVQKIQNSTVIENWTYYDDRPTSDWHDSMLDIFYPDNVDSDFFEDHAQMGMEINLLYKIMQKVHLVFFGYGGRNIPRRTQNIPYSSKWKEYQKFNPQYKNPRDYDKKRKISMRYDADQFLL